ncbi:hypothetical protein ACJX0J_026875, partial [Zea mays]
GGGIAAAAAPERWIWTSLISKAKLSEYSGKIEALASRLFSCLLFIEFNLNQSQHMILIFILISNIYEGDQRNQQMELNRAHAKKESIRAPIKLDINAHIILIHNFFIAHAQSIYRTNFLPDISKLMICAKLQEEL